MTRTLPTGSPAPLDLTAQDYRDRRGRLALTLQERGYGAMVVFGPARVSYLTGFYFAATERPVAALVSDTGDGTLFVPALEADHVRQQCPDLGDPVTYPEYPGGGSGEHPLLTLGRELRRRFPHARALAADLGGYESRWGYRGPRLEEAAGLPVHEHLEFVDDARAIKSPAEIALIREACHWGDYAHGLMQQALEIGSDEMLVSHETSLRATRDMLAALGSRYVPKAREGLPANTMFIRGRNTANPHGLHQTGGVQAGDILVTGAYGVVGGYESELERTMFVGEPTPEQARWFGAMLAAQDAGMAALKPGRPCHEVEQEVRAVLEAHGAMPYVRHHTGHAFGMEGHEHPFLDLDDPTEIRPGMIFSIEPGIYVPGLGGFRHSDTLVVTETGAERLSLYPRDLQSLTVPV